MRNVIQGISSPPHPTHFFRMVALGHPKIFDRFWFLKVPLILEVKCPRRYFVCSSETCFVIKNSIKCFFIDLTTFTSLFRSEHNKFGEARVLGSKQDSTQCSRESVKTRGCWGEIGLPSFLFPATAPLNPIPRARLFTCLSLTRHPYSRQRRPGHQIKGYWSSSMKGS